ncbi:integrator complex subunit 14 [Brevipalpus obovatus]|uniref:integrator complex subunit 14 n=1 Tax=Brevipalpus obovatus TaxID=246614 RepID=UPI003D9EE252
MPTVILLDVSLSMCRTVATHDANEILSAKQLAIYGLNVLLDYMSSNCKLELTSLMLFSSLWERNVGFTRDYELIKTALGNLDAFYDKTNIHNALKGVQDLIHEEWGTNVPCNIILVTDGNPGISSYSELDTNEKQPFLFNFPAKLHVVCVCDPAEQLANRCVSFYKRLLEMAMPKKDINSNNFLWMPESTTLKAVEKMFQRLAEANYAPYRGTLHCGSLSCSISLFPNLESYNQTKDFETVHAKASNEIIICGFMPISDIASPPVHSRHLVFATPFSKDDLSKLHSILITKDMTNYDVNAATLFDLEEALNSVLTDESREPSLCVLLHGALKIESMVAICRIGQQEWYGMIYAWSDSKKKSNLMLSTFQAGLDSIPWLGDLSKLGPVNIFNLSDEPSPSVQRKSYSTNCVVWTKQPNLLSDLQKILRLARKLPEKTPHFYKELNRFRKAALVTGFFEIIDGLATILERECQILPAGSHPEAALQLTHAVNALRVKTSDATSYDILITPMKTRFEHPVPST